MYGFECCLALASRNVAKPKKEQTIQPGCCIAEGAVKSSNFKRNAMRMNMQYQICQSNTFNVFVYLESVEVVVSTCW